MPFVHQPRDQLTHVLVEDSLCDAPLSESKTSCSLLTILHTTNHAQYHDDCVPKQEPPPPKKKEKKGTPPRKSNQYTMLGITRRAPGTHSRWFRGRGRLQISFHKWNLHILPLLLIMRCCCRGNRSSTGLWAHSRMHATVWQAWLYFRLHDLPQHPHQPPGPLVFQAFPGSTWGLMHAIPG